MKKIKSILFLLVITILLTSCGSTGKLDVNSLSIDDFEWNTEPSKCSGLNCYVFKIKNNSDYDIVAVDITYKVKDDVSKSDLKVYRDFMKEHDDYIDEDASLNDVTLHANKSTLIEKKETFDGLKLTVGFKELYWYDYPTEEQFELMEPSELELAIIYGNKAYVAYYDFIKKDWKLDNKTVVADEWSNTEIAKTLPKPKEKHHIVRLDKDDEYEIYSYGITENDYKSYVEEVKNAGFEGEGDSVSYFKGKNKDGYMIKIYFYDIEKRMSISIEKDD